MTHSTATNTTVTDPVCGMNIDPARAAGSSAYDGRTYHFCSRECETKFDAAAAQYAAGFAAPAPAASCCSTKNPGQPGGYSCC